MNINSNLKYLILILLLICSIALSAKEVNPKANMLKSAVLPGWGQLSLGNNTGYIFLATEALFWSAKFFFSEEKKLKEDESFLYALKYAHIDPTLDYDEVYFDYLGKSDDPSSEPIKDYDSYIQNKAQQEYPNDPELQQEYMEKYAWSWDEDKRDSYTNKRAQIVQFSDYAKIVTGTIFANHIVSAINASVLSSKLNKRLQVNFHFDKEMNPGLTCEYKF